MTHAMRAFRTFASPKFIAILSDTTPAAERARTMASQLNAWIDEFGRLSNGQRCDLRGLALALESLAEQIEDMQQQPQPVRARRWWRIWG
jgi:hypothetical protein